MAGSRFLNQSYPGSSTIMTRYLLVQTLSLGTEREVITIWATTWQNQQNGCASSAQISLGIYLVWSESSLCAQWVAKDPRFLHADSEVSDQTGQADHWAHNHFVGFVMSRLNLVIVILVFSAHVREINEHTNTHSLPCYEASVFETNGDMIRSGRGHVAWFSSKWFYMCLEADQ